VVYEEGKWWVGVEESSVEDRAVGIWLDRPGEVPVRFLDVHVVFHGLRGELEGIACARPVMMRACTCVVSRSRHL